MATVETALKDLIEAIIASPEYTEFNRQIDIMRKHPDLKRQIDNYRQENYELQSSTRPEELFDRMDEFSQRYEKFRRHPMVEPFLEAEVGFCRMIQKINQDIVEAVNFE